MAWISGILRRRIRRWLGITELQKVQAAQFKGLVDVRMEVQAKTDALSLVIVCHIGDGCDWKSSPRVRKEKELVGRLEAVGLEVIPF